MNLEDKIRFHTHHLDVNIACSHTSSTSTDNPFNHTPCLWLLNSNLQRDSRCRNLPLGTQICRKAWEATTNITKLRSNNANKNKTGQYCCYHIKSTWCENHSQLQQLFWTNLTPHSANCYWWKEIEVFSSTPTYVVALKMLSHVNFVP